MISLMRLTGFEPAVYGLKARCHSAWLQTQYHILFMIFLFSLCLHVFFSSFTQFIICHNACDRNRTCNLRFKRPLLYQLSYADMLQRIKEVPVFFYSLLVNPETIQIDYTNGT